MNTKKKYAVGTTIAIIILISITTATTSAICRPLDYIADLNNNNISHDANDLSLMQMAYNNTIDANYQYDLNGNNEYVDSEDLAIMVRLNKNETIFSNDPDNLTRLLSILNHNRMSKFGYDPIYSDNQVKYGCQDWYWVCVEGAGYYFEEFQVGFNYQTRFVVGYTSSYSSGHAWWLVNSTEGWVTPIYSYPGPVLSWKDDGLLRWIYPNIGLDTQSIEDADAYFVHDPDRHWWNEYTFVDRHGYLILVTDDWKQGLISYDEYQNLMKRGDPDWTNLKLEYWDLNKNGRAADIGDLVLMKQANIGERTPDYLYDNNFDGVLADNDDLARMKSAALGRWPFYPFQN